VWSPKVGSSIDCEPYPWEAKDLKKTQFPPPLPGLYGWGTDYTDQRTHKPDHYMPYFIIDRYCSVWYCSTAVYSAATVLQCTVHVHLCLFLTSSSAGCKSLRICQQAIMLSAGAG
jgi:hypothetical protein